MSSSGFQRKLWAIFYSSCARLCISIALPLICKNNSLVKQQSIFVLTLLLPCSTSETINSQSSNPTPSSPHHKSSYSQTILYISMYILP